MRIALAIGAIIGISALIYRATDTVTQTRLVTAVVVSSLRNESIPMGKVGGSAQLLVALPNGRRVAVTKSLGRAFSPGDQVTLVEQTTRRGARQYELAPVDQHEPCHRREFSGA